MLPVTLKQGSEAELAWFLNVSLEHIEPQDLETYISKVGRFNARPVHVGHSKPGQYRMEGVSEEPVQWFFLREDLKLFPDYFTAAQKAKLTYKHATDLLFKTIDAEKYEFCQVHNKIALWTRIFDACDEKSIDLKKHYRALKRFLAVADEYGELDRGLATIHMGIAAGLSVEHSVDIVNSVYEKSDGLEGYVFMGMYDEFYALKTNNVDGKLLHKALEIVIGDDPYYERNFKDFTDLLYFSMWRSEKTQTDVLKEFVQAKEQASLVSGSGEKSLFNTVATRLFAELDNSDYWVPKAPDYYFPDIGAKRVMQGRLPYKIRRSYADGVMDLKKEMARCQVEGAFVFDTAGETWYSFGGRTDRVQDGFQHEFHIYDVSRLSDTPKYIHVHPEMNDIFFCPPVDILKYPSLQKKYTKANTAMPSPQDYDCLAQLIADSMHKVPLSGSIVTSSGVVNMMVPGSSRRIGLFAEKFDDIRSEVILNFDAKAYLEAGGDREEEREFARHIISDLDARMPKGFGVDLQFYEEIADACSRPAVRRIICADDLKQ